MCRFVCYFVVVFVFGSNHLTIPLFLEYQYLIPGHL